MMRFVFFLMVLTMAVACKKDKALNGIDAELFEMAEQTSGVTWYKNSDALLPKSSGSGHDHPFLRTRFNSVAATQLDSEGKIAANAVFPQGSLVVKELVNEDESLGRYAILYKASGNENADANGWVWGYIDADKKVVSSAEKKGASCINCHQQSGSIDYMLMNKFFP